MAVQVAPERLTYGTEHRHKRDWVIVAWWPAFLTASWGDLLGTRLVLRESDLETSRRGRG